VKSFIVLSILLIVLFSVGLSAQEFEEEPAVLQFDAGIGAGIGIAFEKDIFKTEVEKVKASPEVIFNISMHYIVNDHLSFGFLLEGYTQTINDVLVILQSGQPKYENFDLACNNIGADARWTFSTGMFEPYGFAAINLVTGSMQNSDLGNLTMSGLSFGGGLGTKFNFAENWAAQLEAFGFFGTAKWKQKVFTNSANASFNPSHAGLTLGIVFRWGD